MTNEEISVNNKLIGDFMGKNFDNPLNYMYDKEWTWIMPVVIVIEKDADFVRIQNNSCTISRNGWECSIHQERDEKIEAVYYAIVEYIKWKKRL